MENLTRRQIRELNDINTDTEKMKFGEKFQEIIQAAKDGAISEGTPVNAISASAVLEITGVVKHGETVFINNPEADGQDVYQFAADMALSVSPGAIAVDINSDTVKSSNTLTVDTNPTLGDTMTIGEKTFIFVPETTGNAEGEIDMGATLSETQENIVSAIRGTDGHNTPHPLVTCAAAFNDNALLITALIGGTAGDTINTSETFTAASNEFSSGALVNGADCEASDAILALVEAVLVNDTQGVTSAKGEGDTIIFTSDLGGEISNAIAIDETLANGAFVDDAVFLSGGQDGTPGVAGQTMFDSTYLYLCVADNSVAGKNWRRITLGTAF